MPLATTFSRSAPSLSVLSRDVASALIVVDIQRTWYSGSEEVRTSFPHLEVTVPALLSKCRRAGLPIVHVRAKYDCPQRSPHLRFFKQLNPEKPAEEVSTEPESWAREEPGELVVEKPTFDSFHDTSLHEDLRAQGVERIYVCGLVTAACVLNTCMGGFKRGYEVVVVGDCTGDRSREQHEAVLSIYHGYTFVVCDSLDLPIYDDGSTSRGRPPLQCASLPSNMASLCGATGERRAGEGAAARRPGEADSPGDVSRFVPVATSDSPEMPSVPPHANSKESAPDGCVLGAALLTDYFASPPRTEHDHGAIGHIEERHMRKRGDRSPLAAFVIAAGKGKASRLGTSAPSSPQTRPARQPLRPVAAQPSDTVTLPIRV